MYRTKKKPSWEAPS